MEKQKYPIMSYSLSMRNPSDSSGDSSSSSSFKAESMTGPFKTDSISAGGSLHTFVLTPQGLTNVSCKQKKMISSIWKKLILVTKERIFNLDEVKTRDRRSTVLDKLVRQSLPPPPPPPKEVELATSGVTVRIICQLYITKDELSTKRQQKKHTPRKPSFCSWYDVR